jgi:hypothetical protein
VVCYSNGSDAVLDDDVLVITVVSNLHDGLDLCVQSRDNAIPQSKGYPIQADRGRAFDTFEKQWS